MSTYSYQFLLDAIAGKISERIETRSRELGELERLVSEAQPGVPPTFNELGARARLLSLNGQIAKLSRALESIADATTHAGSAQ